MNCLGRELAEILILRIVYSWFYCSEKRKSIARLKAQRYGKKYIEGSII
nr:hypothetical protein 8 [Candidatus Hydrogenedentota bacterium]